MKYLYWFNATYLLAGGVWFLRDINYEFVIYVAVLLIIFGIIFAAQKFIKFPLWLLWLLSIWGLMHVLGGAVPTPDGVLFSYRIYPLIDLGGEFFILKYDQVVHFYLYGVVTMMILHILKSYWGVDKNQILIALVAIMAAMGVSSMNEIMEFIIAISLERNGVGGYENAMLDLIFNFAGAVIGALVYKKIEN